MKTAVRIHVVLVLLLVAMRVDAQPAPAPVPEWAGTDEDKVWGLMTVWAEAKYTFPHFERRPDLDWDAAVQATIPKVLAAGDPDEYYAVLMELVATLEDSHTEIVPPWGRLKPGYDIAPIEVRVVGDHFYVDRVGDRPALAEQGLQPGAEILAVDGVPVSTHFANTVLRYHSMGSTQANQATLIVYLLYGPAGQSTALELRTLDDTVTEVAVTRDAMTGESPFMTRLLANAFASPTIRTRMLEDGIQYVEIPNFEEDQARRDFEALIDSLDETVVSGMVIDLRYNMGGSSSICEPMVASLIDEAVPTPTMKYRHFVGAHEAWGRDTIWETTHGEIQPRDGKRYLGPLVVLTGAVTNSSAEDFAIELRTAGRAQLVGQRTAGGAGNALVSSLPGGGTLRVATFTALTPEGEEYVGVGIAPDVEVRVSQQDLAAGRDPVLERAVDLLRGTR